MRGLALIALGAAIAVTPRASRADGNGMDEVRVHVEGDPQVVLERRIPDVDLWESMCRGKCDAFLPLEGSYRVSGHGIRSSVPLTFASAPDNTVKLEVGTAYSSGYYGSMMLTILGPIIMLSGTFTAIAGATANHESFDEPPCGFGQTCLTPPPQSNEVTIAGIGMIGTGLVMMIAGLYGLGTTNHSTVRQIGNLTLSARSLTFHF
jgi:hypothetical protein